MRNSISRTFQQGYRKTKPKNRSRQTEQRSFSVTKRTITRFRSKLILLDPQSMCLCGLLNISHSVHLIVCIEVFFALVLLIQSPDLLTMNGTYFYFLGFFDGGGVFFFILHVSLCTSCLISAALLYLGSQKTIPALIIPHFLWQLLFIIISISSIIFFMLLGIQGKMLMPASIVLSCMMLVGGGCEIWWCLLSLAFYRYIQEQNERRLWCADNQECGNDSLV